MIQPFHADFFAGTVSHVFPDKITGAVCKQTIKPYKTLILRLGMKLRLTIDRPAKEPAGISGCNDTSGYNLA